MSVVERVKILLLKWVVLPTLGALAIAAVVGIPLALRAIVIAAGIVIAEAVAQ